ncbi:MAG: ATP-binding cassette domain-containing protein [Deltaproteobacteria bacterium]|nr:ATP-binding cassette domain-containing protein [Deltaproteobacteria bacterium]
MSASSPDHLAFDAVSMAFGERRVFDRLSFRFPAGHIAVILGGSGSGKSTALRLIGGLIQPTSGRVLVDSEDVTQLGERALYRVRGKLGMLFQGGALLDAMTVFENCAFPLRERTRLDVAAIAARVRECLDAVGLADAEALLPSQLSGGMVKRAALARAIVMRPTILLCDEPFSGLDPISARRIEALLVELNARFGMTVVVVSHDIASTMRMATQVLVLLPDGAVAGTPEELQRSTDPRVASFLNPDVDAALARSATVERTPGAMAW